MRKINSCQIMVGFIRFIVIVIVLLLLPFMLHLYFLF